MMKGLWQTWSMDEGKEAGSVAGSTASAATHPPLNNNKNRTTISPRHRHSLPSHLLQDDPSIMDVEDEDQLAGRLLIQFPTYGSHNAHNAANLPIHPTADWLLGGTSSIPTTSALQKTSEVTEEQDEDDDNDVNSPEENDKSNTNASSSNNNNNNNNAQAVSSGDWDDDEQTLWKSPKLPDGMRHESSLSNRQAALTSSTYKQRPLPRNTTTTTVNWKRKQQQGGNSKRAPQLTDPSRDWLHAYYYHTGVTPKVSARREPIQSMMVPRKSFAISTTLDQSKQRYQANVAIQKQQQQQMPEMIEDYPDEETKTNIDELIIMSPPLRVATTTSTGGTGGGGPTPTSTGAASGTPSGIGARPTPTDAVSTLTALPATPVDDRQHWMPDQLCKHCYACDTPFTVFRRRHHCRLCGQVFCNSCSGYFVPASQSQGVAGVQPHHNTHVLEQHQGSSQQQQSLHQQTSLAPGQQQQQQQQPGVSSRTILRTCKMCFDQVTAQQQQQLEEISILDFKKRKKNYQEDSNKPPPPPPPPPPPHISTMPTVKSSTLLKDLESDSVLHSLSKKQSAEKSFLAKRRLLSQQQAMEQEEKEQTSLLLLQHQHHPHHKPGPVPSPTRPTTRTSGPSPIRSGSSSNNNKTSSSAPCDNQDKTAKAAYRHLGLTAAAHLEQLGTTLLESDAPLLWQEVAVAERRGPDGGGNGSVALQKQWVHKLMSLATRCCATVEPNVKKGDLLDIRPYCKIKVIPGGSYQDCAYMSGVLFRKTLSHKRTAKEISNPRIMLLSGGIEFTRTENRIASLDTMLEQEGKYMEILVGKILKLQPDILMVGRSVSRKAQELLLKANVVLLQHVKSTLLSRISRQTGATIISSTDHIMNQFGAHVLGKCHRFRFIVARDNEVWTDGDNDIPPIHSKINVVGKNQRNIRALLEDDELPNHERQAALAANMLGQGVVDGTEAVKCGLAKRGVAQTYVMLEGCPKHLGCTVVLRGASRAALKQAKIVFRFLVNVAYNLKLETSYFKERCVALRPNFSVQSKNLYSSSLCVDYGQASGGRKIRPWNGGTNNERSISGNVTAFDHQSILITSVWMTDKTQCCPAEVKGICYYSLQDVSLGQFLRDSCFNLSLKCQNPTCKKSVLDHSLSFVHNDGLINITVDHMDGPLPPAPIDGSRKSDDNNKSDDNDGEEIEDSPIATWTFCKHCNKVVTPLVYISENTWKYSFGKFLESFFYNRDAVMNSPEHGCSCELQTSATLFFGCGRLAARLTYERVRPFGVFVRRSLPIDTTFHRGEALRQLERISMASSQLFVKFDKHIAKVSREARLLYGNSANRPEHLQTVLSELNRISSEVDHAAKTLQEKISSVSHKCSKDNDGVVNEALFRFPWFSRRYLFMLTSAWNEKLSAAGQAIVAMKKLATSASLRMDPNVPTIVGDPISEELHEGMRRLRQLHEVYSRYNLTDITTQLPIIPGAAGATTRSEIEYNDDDFEDPDGAIEYADGVDADVLASRRRLYSSKTITSVQPEGDRNDANRRPTKSLGTRRSDDPQLNRANQHRLAADAISNATVSAKVTPGGAVKSAITRFFNRGGRELDPYVVDLGIFNEGRPRLEPGVNGIVVPVMDEQLCTVIAYSLSSTEYANQFQSFSKLEATGPDNSSELGSSSGPNSGSNNDGSGQQRGQNNAKTPQQTPAAASGLNNKQDIERRMLVRNKSHIKHTFRDFDEKGQNLCKFVCTTYWATQFHAVRQVFLSPSGGKDQPEGSTAFGFQSELDVEQSYVQSLSSAYAWAASGGKSGASFARTRDDRFVIKCISRTELQMFLDCAPAYFEYLSKAFFHGLPTVLCKIVGVYQIGYHNRVTGKRSMEQVAVMQNIFYNRRITKIFDLKGSLRGRFAAQVQSAKDGTQPETPAHSEASSRPRKRGSEHGSDAGFFPKLDGDSEGEDGSGEDGQVTGTLLDGDFLEFTAGRPMPMDDRAKAVFHMSILNDTLFLSIINVLDYSILVGIDEDTMELVVGVIDFMRQYDILKQMERVGKSLPMVVGSEAPTIIQPPLYKARFTNAMERYFMTVPSKWTTI